MIEQGEIAAASERMRVHVAHVQRDYVFGWLLKEIAQDAYLGKLLVLKGATCLRKVYLPESRYSEDLDFAAAGRIDPAEFSEALKRCCAKVGGITSVKFDIEKTLVRLHRTEMGRGEVVKEIYRAVLFFADFYGNVEQLSLAVQMDVSTMDPPVLAVAQRSIVHAYSDAGLCQGVITCLALEELIAAKLKCLLQRRHALDLFDVAYAHFLRDEVSIDLKLVASAFLKKTIFRGSPGAAREILLAVPTEGLESDWSERLVCPPPSWLGLDVAAEKVGKFVSEVFSDFRSRSSDSETFFPAALRFPLLRAGAERKMVRFRYDGTMRTVEPYALLFKKPGGGEAREYFYGWNVEGGSSPEGWRTFLGHKIELMEVTGSEFEPRVDIQLSKAAEKSEVVDFGRNESARVRSRPKTSSRGIVFGGYAGAGYTYLLQCPYCQKKFKRTTRDSALNPHKDPGGYACRASRGVFLN
jgi:predicted nucleotidyltransferase component of viral defense system